MQPPRRRRPGSARPGSDGRWDSTSSRGGRPRPARLPDFGPIGGTSDPMRAAIPPRCDAKGPPAVGPATGGAIGDRGGRAPGRWGPTLAIDDLAPRSDSTASAGPLAGSGAFQDRHTPRARSGGGPRRHKRGNGRHKGSRRHRRTVATWPLIKGGKRRTRGESASRPFPVEPHSPAREKSQVRTNHFRSGGAQGTVELIGSRGNDGKHRSRVASRPAPMNPPSRSIDQDSTLAAAKKLSAIPKFPRRGGPVAADRPSWWVGRELADPLRAAVAGIPWVMVSPPGRPVRGG